MLTLLGLAGLTVLLWAARRFARAQVANVKALLAWVGLLALLTLGAGLLLSGRGVAALLAVALLTPLAASWWVEGKRPRGNDGPRSVPSRPGRMTRAEALAVLGLRDPVTEAEVQAAWQRLMRAAHPDAGGSDWLAARVNEARDTLKRA